MQHKDVIIYYKPGLRISNFFLMKDSMPFELRSHVYQFTCGGCNSSYIGQTAQHLCHRIAEYTGTSHLMGKTMKSQFPCGIRQHCCLCTGSECSAQHFKILAQGSTEFELMIK